MSDCVIDENDMARCVRKTLKDYFKTLDGEDPCCDLFDMVVSCVERPMIEMALEHAGGNQTRAAELLGINRNTLRKKVQEYGIK